MDQKLKGLIVSVAVLKFRRRDSPRGRGCPRGRRRWPQEKLRWHTSVQVLLDISIVPRKIEPVRVNRVNSGRTAVTAPKAVPIQRPVIAKGAVVGRTRDSAVRHAFR